MNECYVHNRTTVGGVESGVLALPLFDQSLIDRQIFLSLRSKIGENMIFLLSLFLEQQQHMYHVLLPDGSL